MSNYINKYASTTAYANDTTKDYPNVSYIEGDEVKMYEYDPDHIVCKYNVTSTESATKLSKQNSGITYQIIDGVQQQSVVKSYIFDTLGEHIVKYKMNGNSINGAVSYNQGYFYDCSSLTNVTIPNSITSIGNYAFNACSNLTTINIPNGVTTIGKNLLQQTAIIQIIIPNSVTSIDDNAFDSCKELSKINSKNAGEYIIPNSVTSIGNNAFQNNWSLISLVIPNSVTNIGQNAFKNCTSLTSVTVQATTPPTLGTNVFDSNASGRKIYVPAESVNAYKAASGWSDYASAIEAIPNS